MASTSSLFILPLSRNLSNFLPKGDSWEKMIVLQITRNLQQT
jgi:hypothetical protein